MRQTWLWILIIVGWVPPLVIVAVFAGRDAKGLIPFFCVLSWALLNVAGFYYTRLETIVTGDGIYYRWWPWFRKFTKIEWSNVEEAFVKKYTGMQYGAVKSKEFGKAHVTENGTGIQLLLNDGRKFFFGSRRTPALMHTIEKLRDERQPAVSILLNPSL